MSEQITVGFDGSESSAEAVRWAACEAVARGTSLQIVSCYEIAALGASVPAWPATEAVASLLEATERTLQTIVDAVAESHPELKITPVASAGPAAMVLLHQVEPDDLVVMGASSHEGAAAFWLGSTPRHLVRHSPCPVVVVRDASSRGRPDRIVVGVDASAASDRALRWAASEADRHQVDLVVVHGWWYPYLTTETGTSQARDLTQIDAACVLEQAVDLARDQCGADVAGQLVENSTVSAILNSVRDGDLLVLGSRGRGAITSGLFGSTVNSVLDQSSVPVVVVPTPEAGASHWQPVSRVRTV